MQFNDNSRIYTLDYEQLLIVLFAHLSFRQNTFFTFVY